MNVQDYLMQIKDIDLRIRSLEGELHDSCAEEDAGYADELRDRIEADIERCKEIRIRIRDQIQQLRDNRSVILLTEYYVRGRSWEQVAAALDLKSVKNVREGLHNKALEQFLKKFGKYLEI